MTAKQNDPASRKPPTQPDRERCQVETITRTPFTLGGTHKTERCVERPVFIATESKPGPDGQCGSMSMCAFHAAAFLNDPRNPQCIWESVK